MSRMWMTGNANVSEWRTTTFPTVRIRDADTCIGYSKHFTICYNCCWKHGRGRKERFRPRTSAFCSLRVSRCSHTDTHGPPSQCRYINSTPAESYNCATKATGWMFCNHSNGVTINSGWPAYKAVALFLTFPRQWHDQDLSHINNTLAWNASTVIRSGFLKLCTSASKHFCPKTVRGTRGNLFVRLNWQFELWSGSCHSEHHGTQPDRWSSNVMSRSEDPPVDKSWRCPAGYYDEMPNMHNSYYITWLCWRPGMCPVCQRIMLWHTKICYLRWTVAF